MLTRRLSPALVLTLLCILLVPGLAEGPTARAASLGQRDATRVFALWIRQRFPAVEGRWICPRAQVQMERVPCLGEFRAGGRWHEASAAAAEEGSETVIVEGAVRSWRRRWTPYTKRVIRGFGLPGRASVNGVPAADWPFLAAGASYDLRHRRTTKVVAYDGNSSGFRPLVTFRCRRYRRLIKCRNRFGDAMRYRPGG